jgi:hypothetical protein
MSGIRDGENEEWFGLSLNHLMWMCNFILLPKRDMGIWVLVSVNLHEIVTVNFLLKK